MQDSQEKLDSTDLRVPSYISPSGLKCFEKNQEEYFIRYLSPYRTERMPQTHPMSVGSAFDAFVKSYLHRNLLGHYGKDNEYEERTIFENQVEEQNWDWAWPNGRYVFEKYKLSGALADMMMELQTSIGDPRFEFDIKGTIQTNVGEIPMLGKPDIFFINNEGARVIFDWKVNGYCGKRATSPNKGYLRIRDAWTTEAKHTRTNGMAHRDCVIGTHHGIKVNKVGNMEDLNLEWADQLSIYGWLLGEEIGSEQLVIGIDQIVSQGKEGDTQPLLRVASFRSVASSRYQFALKERIEFLWKCIQTGHIFFNLTKEENDAKIEKLLGTTKQLSGDNPTLKAIHRWSRS